MNKLRVSLGERSYDIKLGDNILESTGILLKEVFLGKDVLIVTDNHVAPRYLEVVKESLETSGYKVVHIVLPAGENTKSWRYAQQIFSLALERGLGRNSAFLALGGGVIGDLTGYCAASYMRGVFFVQLPTTLLAQVDSSVGGKVAINLPQGKNMIGYFYQPSLVVSDLDVLSTLPKREISSGLAEIIKYGVIWDRNLFTQLTKSISQNGELKRSALLEIVLRSCQIKSEIVAKDERESGLRMILNYGHTFGHALEKVTNYAYFRHGEAISHGMLMAIELAKIVGSQKEDFQSVRDLIVRSGLMPCPPGITKDSIFQAIQYDKKKNNGKPTFILSPEIGKAEIIDEISKEDIEQTIEHFFINC